MDDGGPEMRKGPRTSASPTRTCRSQNTLNSEAKYVAST
jgi:hypothetical protein